jgi:hypothetical protein
MKQHCQITLLASLLVLMWIHGALICIDLTEIQIPPRLASASPKIHSEVVGHPSACV